jgi:hypothetical protein
MASTINASTSSGLVNTADTSGVLQLQTANTTAVTIDASQNVGIGTASPSQKLSVAGLISSTGRNLAAGFFNSTNVTGVIVDATSADFYTNNAFAMGINSVGGVKVLNTLGVGNTTPSTSGAGITFPATQSASSDANTLDDYEEGTWTPTDASGASIGITPTTSYYIKVGRLVTCWTQIQYPSTANGSVAKIGGYPFAATSAEAFRSGTMIGYKSSATLTTVLLQLAAANNDFRDSTGTSLTNAQMSSVNIYYAVTYLASA